MQTLIGRVHTVRRSNRAYTILPPSRIWEKPERQTVPRVQKEGGKLLFYGQEKGK